jgi:DNA-binding HxlR family transcriptional regulator
MSDGNYQALDEILHSRIRLAIVSILIAVEEIDFTLLKHRVGATDGNMNSHLKKLEQAGYVGVKKRFVERKPVTTYWLTAKGRENFKKYVAILEGFIKPRAEKG